MGVYNDLVFTEGVEQAEALVKSQNADEIGARIALISTSPELSQVVIMLLTVKAKGIDTTTKTGIELANSAPSIEDLLLPPGFNR